MKIDEYLGKVEKSDEFQKLKKDDEKSYFCSAFFVRDFEGKQNETQIDFYSPNKKKVVSFKIDGNKIERIPLEKDAITLTHKKFVPKEIIGKSKLDVEQVKDIVIDGMHNKGFTDTIKKMMIVHQDIDGKQVWNCTCFLAGLSLLQVHIDDESKTVLYMDKKSFLDMIVPLKPGEKLEDALKKRKKEMEEKKIDIEKVEGNNEGFIG